jgi:hypothetical protein
MVITGMSGFVNFMVGTIIAETMQPSASRGMIFVSRLNILEGWEKILGQEMESILLDPAESAAIHAAVGDRGTLITQYFLVVPELSFMGDAYFSYMADPEMMAQLGPAMFNFNEGDWASAIPIMQQGCGVLVAPLVAQKNDAGLGDTITVTGADGPVQCTIAGIGTSVANASLISARAYGDFQPGNPVMELLVPHLGVSLDAIEADLVDTFAAFPNLYSTRVRAMVDMQLEAVNLLYNALGGMLLLATVAAALGVVNTTLMSITERRREIGLLRAVGATRGQVRGMLLGEAALMGLIGGFFGLVAGLGFVIVFVVSYGGNSWGVDVRLWPTALESLRPALYSGAIGLIAAPVIAALAAWFPARRVLQEGAITLLDHRRE